MEAIESTGETMTIYSALRDTEESISFRRRNWMMVVLVLATAFSSIGR